MQVLLSPAKSMDFSISHEADAAGMYDPVVSTKTDELVEVLSSQSVSQLEKTLGVSTTIAQENFDRLKSWNTNEMRQAIVAYDGFAYAKLRGRTLSTEEMKIAHAKIIMISGMWGPVRALTGIKPYRLEMACKKLPKPYTKLADFWKEDVTEEIINGFSPKLKKKEKQNILINVASEEYAAAVDFDALRSANITIVKIDFYQAGKRAPTVHLKYGRGLITRYIIQNNIDNLTALQSFNLEGFSFSAQLSDEHTYVFSRDAAPPRASVAAKGSSKRKRDD
eukprot:CAMPEP_0197291650 /NCGR_PEP_ID=MMETSP0890-20130614/17895_1 /TAXON_ID=44058 ORGANISM="Aureoumbra lagunensis, Strain CCMP1510" /NCGR_SAMPLE_ID=MMETSP0890 /ASSEMBLY_ACC=CAM_ASM_000533 /LENGTH=278 /DNA_ID=CAMNT_0042764893 /DNA_START=109 /DNA_END=945 /DNA_ORIENTATION=-